MKLQNHQPRIVKRSADNVRLRILSLGYGHYRVRGRWLVCDANDIVYSADPARKDMRAYRDAPPPSNPVLEKYDVRKAVLAAGLIVNKKDGKEVWGRDSDGLYCCCHEEGANFGTAS